jgi:adenine-specific DNA-methyltransferase
MFQSSSREFIESDRHLLEFNSLADYSTTDLLCEVDFLRIIARSKQKQKQKQTLGQFLTPALIAQLMAGMFELDTPQISLLDAGAGIGSLLAAFVANFCDQQKHPTNLNIVAYEIDPFLIGYLHQTLELCVRRCQIAGISFNYEIRNIDFIEDAVRLLQPNLFDNSSNNLEFTHAILNPPYLKIKANSQVRILLRSLGLETSNLYTGFIAATAQLLKSGGELVAISPRSFCNGLYFKDFRRMFLETMALRQIHLFELRNKAFSDDEVLQETIIIHAIKQKQKFDSVLISTSLSADDELVMSNSLSYREIVNPNDSQQFIHIIPDNLSQQVVRQMANFTCTLKDLGLAVSTGRVVDFRVKEYLRLTLQENGES